MVLIKQKERSSKNPNNILSEKELDQTIVKQLVTEMGFTDLLSKNENPVEISKQSKFLRETIDEALNKRIKYEIEKPQLQLPSQNTSYSTHIVSRNESRTSVLDDYLSNFLLDGEDSLSDLEGFLPDFEELSESSSGLPLQNELVSDYRLADQSNYTSSAENDDSDFISQSPRSLHTSQFTFSEESNDSKLGQMFTKKMIKSGNLNEFSSHIPVTGLFNANIESRDDLPWKNTKIHSQLESLLPATEYEEVQMLNNLNLICRKAQYKNIDKKLIRLRAKLSVRKAKKTKHLMHWNIDRLVCELARFPIRDSLSQFTQIDVRVLDRFQHTADSLSGCTLPSQVDFATRLSGQCQASPFVSPYSGRMLKPYIRRDTHPHTLPLWLQLMGQLRTRVHGSNAPILPAAPLDYCYVRPQHIASINNLCAQYFWPGIDLTEALQYPDFSCVVLYKKLIVAFAFLVPDVGPNEAYISFIFTRPEWRKAGIANFMLYHLIQTSIDKDITLHVSPTNPGIFLYQKFGFKIEELIQEFYEKYYPADSTECKHALFLRLCR